MKALDLIKKYKIHILVSLLIIVFFRSCGKSRTITGLEKKEKISIETIDSLKLDISLKTAKIDSFPSILRIEKLSIHLMYNDTISKLDRTSQTMWLQKNVTLPSIKELQK